MERTDLDMRRALQQMQPDEARRFRRKFRKMWRAALKATPADTAAPKRLGVRKRVPSRAERNARKQLVFNKLWKERIEPIIKRFDSCTSAKPENGPPAPSSA